MTNSLESGPLSLIAWIITSFSAALTWKENKNKWWYQVLCNEEC